jgi:hypothetical protein
MFSDMFPFRIDSEIMIDSWQVSLDGGSACRKAELGFYKQTIVKSGKFRPYEAIFWGIRLQKEILHAFIRMHTNNLK